MDKYDDAIEWLVEHADEISKYGEQMVEVAWGNNRTHQAGCLFAFCYRDDSYPQLEDWQSCGCLTMIRSNPKRYVAATPALTLEISLDSRLPREIEELRDLRGDNLRAALQPFAEWQRRLDKEIRQTIAA